MSRWIEVLEMLRLASRRHLRVDGAPLIDTQGNKGYIIFAEQGREIYLVRGADKVDAFLELERTLAKGGRR